MLYNLSEFITKVKEDIGVADIKLPVDDAALVKRFATSALKEFSVRYPYKIEIILTNEDALDLNTKSLNGSITYVIPKAYYEGTSIISVLGILPSGYRNGGDLYYPNVMLGSADMVLESIADIKMAAELGSMMSHAATFAFHMPDKLTIYNGWANTSQRVELALMHDVSLSTIPPGAFTHLFQLAELDMKEHLYNKMKRITELDVGIGSINLKIDSWESAAQDKRDLLERWDDTICFDMDRVMYF